ncbi:MAG: SpoIID/LytB domain-containing protein [Candidatus Omnitrophota bacterium]|nr:SpoIID/LytB domain-containing protein [Candidatus Omnitrophota bacterium]
MMKKTSVLLSLVLALSFAPVHASSAAEKENNPVMRVLVLDNRDSMSLAVKGTYRIYSMPSEKLLTGGYILHTKVRASEQGIMFGARKLKFSKIRITVPEGALIYLDGRSFRGIVDIIKKDNMKLAVINRITLEEYLYGVLYNEVSHRWPIEAIKAQGIAARTFALYQARQNKLQDYDMTNDIYSQVYSGATSERWSTTRAVKLTLGKILIFKSGIFPTYYHATCGGRTEDAANLWNIDIEPLKGSECGFCKESPHYKWTKNIPLSEIEKKLSDNGYKIGKIKSVTAMARNKSGRVDKIEIRDDSDVSCVLTGKDFRRMMGPNDVRSANFEPSVNNDKLVLSGIGWGHGVGMCQWGANGMAGHGRNAEEILKIYYPGAKVTTIDKIADKL